MFITKKHLDRRTFLRGAVGTAIALPLLDAMVPAATAQTLTAASQRFRFGAIYMPNGVYPGTWHPTKVGKDFEFNRTHEAARAVPRPADDGQPAEGSGRQEGHGRHPHGRERRVLERHGAPSATTATST